MSSGPGCESADQGHCVLFLYKTLVSHSISLHRPRGINGYTVELLTQLDNIAADLTCNGLATHSGKWLYSMSLHSKETGVGCGSSESSWILSRPQS